MLHRYTRRWCMVVNVLGIRRSYELDEVVRMTSIRQNINIHSKPRTKIVVTHKTQHNTAHNTLQTIHLVHLMSLQLRFAATNKCRDKLISVLFFITKWTITSASDDAHIISIREWLLCASTHVTVTLIKCSSTLKFSVFYKNDEIRESTPCSQRTANINCKIITCLCFTNLENEPNEQKTMVSSVAPTSIKLNANIHFPIQFCKTTKF